MCDSGKGDELFEEVCFEDSVVSSANTIGKVSWLRGLLTGQFAVDSKNFLLREMKDQYDSKN